MGVYARRFGDNKIVAKRDKLRIGMWVICKKKSIWNETFADFLEDYPLGVAKITSISEEFNTVNIGGGYSNKPNYTYMFRPSDLEIIDGQE